jgi:hypothetical protein
MADQNFVEHVQQLVEAQNASAQDQLKVLNGLLIKANYIEQRIERLQKLRNDQFRHLVQFLLNFDDNLGGLYGFVTGIKEVLDHCPFESTLDQKVFLWSAALKARSQTLYCVFETERQLIQAKSLQTGIGELEGNVDANIEWLDRSLTKAHADLQVALRNCFRTEFLKLLDDLDTTALEQEIASAYSQPLGLEQISGIQWYGLEAYARIQNMLQQAQALVEEKHIVAGKLVSAEQVLKIFQEKLNEPLKPLSPFTFPMVELQLDDAFKNIFKRVVSKANIEVTED